MRTGAGEGVVTIALAILLFANLSTAFHLPSALPDPAVFPRAVPPPSPAPLDTTAPVTSAEISGAVGANGWYNSPLIVTLSATDAESGVASTAYRIDGGMLQAYEGVPFSITPEGPHTLEFNSTDNVGNAEPVQNRSVPIDSVPPSATAQLQGTLDPSGWYRSAVTIILTASDATSGVASLEYRVDGTGWQPYADAFVLGEGEHALEYRAMDVSGLVDAHRVDARVDGTAPTCDAFMGGRLGDNGWWRGDVVLTLACADATSGIASSEYRLDSSPWVEYTAPTTLPLSDGSHTAAYRAADHAGNVAPEGLLIIGIDREGPTVAIVAPVPGMWFNGSAVTVRWSASDSTSGVDRFEVSVDSASPQAVSSMEIPLDGLEEGLHAVTVRAIDAAGNTADGTVTFGVDTQEPAISIASPAPAAVVTDRRVRLEANAIDATSGVALCLAALDGREPEEFQLPGTVVYEGLADGAHTVRIACSDLAGNEAVVTRAFVVVTDPLNPSGPFGPWLLSGVLAIPVTIAIAAFALLRRRRRRTEERETDGAKADSAGDDAR